MLWQPVVLSIHPVLKRVCQSFSLYSELFFSSVSGLAVLADSFPEQILQRLLGEYQTGATVGPPKRERSLETRLKVGEVLMRACRAMGEHSVSFSYFFLSVFFSCFKILAPFQDLFVRSGQCRIPSTSVRLYFVSRDHSVWV